MQMGNPFNFGESETIVLIEYYDKIYLALPVQPFIADNFDDPNELLQLMYDLEKLKKEEDVRIELKKKYNVVELLKESNLL